jgi:hypothetical protein
MKLYRIIMSAHFYTPSAYLNSPGWKSTRQVPTFYVHAQHSEHARLVAVDIVMSMHPATCDGSYTSGTALQVDSSLDPIGMAEEEYLSWNQ